MKVKTYNVIPQLPEEIQSLREIAMNLWSSWNWQVAQLFIRLDAETWERCRQNLVMTLSELPQSVIEEAARDDSFIANLNRVWLTLQSYLSAKTWFEEEHSDLKPLRIGYFSMEFGLDVGLPIYSGGLGILAGDHLKSSSDLGLPLVGVGLLYQHGYFEQFLNSDGWQMEKYPVNDWHNMPVTLERNREGKPLEISVDLAGETLKAHIWRAQVGRVPLYLLDSNIPENPPHLRQVTGQLYGGDRENRLRQEILLGIGGLRALKALGVEPTVVHINEGHSAFLALERLRALITERGMTFAEAWELVFATSVFTTHTPVPAGNEMFDLNLVRKYFEKFAQELGLTWDQFAALGRTGDENGVFSMTVLALKTAAHCNGVSRLHGRVSRRMWSSLWPGLPVDEIPIGHITNGIHTRTWISHDLDELIARYIGPQFVEEPHNQKLWERIARIPDLELWRIHQIRKERLIFFARKRLKAQLQRRGAGMAEIQTADEVLSSDLLTIGFARRFATYKRANLILSDPERLRKLLTADKGIQFIFAGKAHPQDNEGKEYIRRIIHFASDPAIRRRFVFIENYDINVARYMVQGVDVWLSTPLRPLEASGTSGMKAAANGAINVSTLDGWWDEACTPEVGWAIGTGQSEGSRADLDRIESEALYNLLEQEIIPTYYEVDRAEVPRRWIALMKRSMIALGQQFNTHRMVMQYADNYYFPAHRKGQVLGVNNGAKARELAKWRAQVSERWKNVTVRTESGDDTPDVRSGTELPIRVRVMTGGLSPDDLAVEVLYGRLDMQGEIADGKVARLRYAGERDGQAVFEGALPCDSGGRRGYAVRVRPHNPDAVHNLTPLWLTWES